MDSFSWILDHFDSNTRLVMGNFRTLIVDDDPIFAAQVEQALFNLYRITIANTAEQARSYFKREHFDIILLDQHLPNDQSGISLIPEIKGCLPHAVIIMLTAAKTDETILEALKAGASDYLRKTPTVTSDLMGRISVAMQRLTLERRLQKAESLASDQIHFEMVGASQSIRELKTTVQTLCGNDINVLISGETGTGKELVARALNQSNGDPTRPFVSVNLGAVPTGLIESELFGHAKGAFTGATGAKAGKIELANGGDIFLDEIGELSLEVQVKLLRVLQEGEFYRVGCNQKRVSKFRVISATNKDLQEMITAGRFREDLFYRIAAFEISTTPLRDRREDIPSLMNHFVRKLEGQRYSFSQEVIDYFCGLQWKGNVRELENRVRSALAFVKARRSYTISLNDVVSEKEKIKEIKSTFQGLGMESRVLKYNSLEYQDYLATAEKEYLRGALGTYDWNIDLTAEKLGISRSKMYQRVASFGLQEMKESKRRRELQ